MGSLSDYAENAILDHILGVAPMAQPAGLYLGLGIDVTDDAGFNEVTGDNYARVLVPTWDAAAASGSGRGTANSSAVQFPGAGPSGWGTPNFWGVFDAATLGNCLAYGTITPAAVITEGDIVNFAAGVLQVEFADSVGNVGWSNYIVQQILDHVFGVSAGYTSEAPLYVGFATALFTQDGIISGECANANGYVRTLVGGFDAAVGGVADNTNDVLFAVTGGDWTPNLQTMFVAKNLAGLTNNDLLFFSVVPTFSPTQNDTVEILAGQLDITVD